MERLSRPLVRESWVAGQIGNQLRDHHPSAFKVNLSLFQRCIMPAVSHLVSKLRISAWNRERSLPEDFCENLELSSQSIVTFKEPFGMLGGA